MAALVEGDVDECERILDEIARGAQRPVVGGADGSSPRRSAELALARGQLREGLRLYLELVEEMRA